MSREVSKCPHINSVRAAEGLREKSRFLISHLVLSFTFDLCFSLHPQLKSFHNELLSELEKKVELDARYLTVGISSSLASVFQRGASDLQRPNLTEAITGGDEDVSPSKFVWETIRGHSCEQRGEEKQYLMSAHLSSVHSLYKNLCVCVCIELLHIRYL